MKNIWISLVALFAILIATPAFAQKGQGKREQWAQMTPEQRADKATSKMTRRYALNNDQAAKLKIANLDFANKMKSVRDTKSTMDPKTRRDTRKGYIAEHQAAIKNILTPDQYSKFEADRKKAQERRAQNQANRGKGKGKGLKGAATAQGLDVEEVDIEDILED
jgi:Spy/CpxP family protein refolding chaperone